MIYTTRSINSIPINIPTIHAYTHFLTTHLFIYTMCLPSSSSILLFFCPISSHIPSHTYPHLTTPPLNPFLSLSLHIFLTTFSLSTPHALHAHPFLTHLRCPFYFPYPPHAFSSFIYPLHPLHPVLAWPCIATSYPFHHKTHFLPPMHGHFNRCIYSSLLPVAILHIHPPRPHVYHHPPMHNHLPFTHFPHHHLSLYTPQPYPYLIPPCIHPLHQPVA